MTRFPGSGFNPANTYQCLFTDTLSSSKLTLTSSPVKASSPTLINCTGFSYVSTADTRANISFTVSVWAYSGGKRVAKVPADVLAAQTYTINRCKNGFKDGSESDADCGGMCGSTCAIGQTCNAASDCKQKACDSATKKCISREYNLLGSQVRFLAGVFAIVSVSAKASLPISLSLSPPFPFPLPSTFRLRYLPSILKEYTGTNWSEIDLPSEPHMYYFIFVPRTICWVR